MSSEGVMATNDDASNCKRYAVSKTYWRDNYIQHFVKKMPDRKAPEINRGYYIRHKAIRSLVDQFLLKTNCQCQIISLGAGFDTLFWNLASQNHVPKHGLCELDLKPVTDRKLMAIKTNQALTNVLCGEVKIENSKISSSLYHLRACDVTNVTELNDVLTECQIDRNVPTLFIAECLFVYIPHERVEKLLDFVRAEFTTCIVVDYDPVNMSDRFGEVMKRNLRSRSCHLMGAHADLASKEKSYGMFPSVNVKLMFDVYDELERDEKQRIEKLEFLDEVDLLFDLLKHYCICVAYSDPLCVGLDAIEL